MKNNELAKRLRELRIRKGMSQEALAETAGLSLRTIQRIENAESKPTGETLKRLSNALDVSPDELIDWTIKEDKGFLLSLNLSALSYIIFPLLGILVPLIIWISKKDKIHKLNGIAKDLLNFQITWTMLLFVGYTGIHFRTFHEMNTTGDINAATISSGNMLNLIYLGIMYSYNFILIVINAVRIKNEKAVNYYPKISFIRK